MDENELALSMAVKFYHDRLGAGGVPVGPEQVVATAIRFKRFLQQGR